LGGSFGILLGGPSQLRNNLERQQVNKCDLSVPPGAATRPAPSCAAATHVDGQKSVNKTRDLQADLGREILAKSLEMFY